MTFQEFLNGFSSILDFFYFWLVSFANLLIENYYILILLGFIALYFFIDILFDLMHNFLFNLTRNVDDYLDEQADLRAEINDIAIKELVKRQNATLVFDPARNNVVDRHDAEINRAATRELVTRQNISQVFDPNSNSIVTLDKEQLERKFRINNLRYHAYGLGADKRDPIGVPDWFDKKIESHPATEEEMALMDEMINSMIKDSEERRKK